MQPPEKLWSIEDVGEYLGVPERTLYHWRRKRTGPPAKRVGRHLLYDPEAVRSWFNDLDDNAA